MMRPSTSRHTASGPPFGVSALCYRMDEFPLCGACKSSAFLGNHLLFFSLHVLTSPSKNILWPEHFVLFFHSFLSFDCFLIAILPTSFSSFSTFPFLSFFHSCAPLIFSFPFFFSFLLFSDFTPFDGFSTFDFPSYSSFSFRSSFFFFTIVSLGVKGTGGVLVFSFLYPCLFCFSFCYFHFYFHVVPRLGLEEISISL
ncbi:hypothetical protein DFH27DRAFT_46060 [Peziza echinospora]|nr:hypothetical protein DFH27DRAFT_46060 [Peziza echinospora]